MLAPDGGFDDHGVFVAAEPPTDVDVRALLVRAGRRVIALLSRFFVDDDDRRREIDHALHALDAASASPPPPGLFQAPPRRASLSAFIEGFSLHAATRVPASDRRGLWRLCAYGARGAIALSRLTELKDGRFAYDMKRSLPDGRSRLVMTGVELLKKLVPLIPPTYANLTRFHGVFAPTSRLRSVVVPPPPVAVRAEPVAKTEPRVPPSTTPSKPLQRSTYRLDWAALLKRVFAVDVMVCARCDGPMKVIALLEEPAVVKRILAHLQLPSVPLTLARSQAPPLTGDLFDL